MASKQAIPLPYMLVTKKTGCDKTTPNTIRDIHNNNNVVRGDKYTSEFLEWWNLYPRKDGSKAKAFES